MARASSVLQVLFLLLCCSACASFFSFDKAVIFPEDAFVFIGETLKVECKLKKNAVNISSSNMQIAIFYHTSSNPWVVPKENTTIVDNKTISVLIEITDSYSHYPTIACQTPAEKMPLTTIGIYVERPIQNITNFSGVYFYDKYLIVTTWNLGVNYLGDVDVIIDWNPNSEPNLSGNNCSSSTLESCTFRYNGQDIVFIRIIVLVQASNRPGEKYLTPLFDTQATSVHKFILMDNMKTEPPQSVTVIDKSSTCLNISWQDSDYYNHSISNSAIYRFEMKAENETEFRTVADNVTKPKSAKFMQLCQLIPYTKYFLGVRIKAMVINPWSELAIKEFLTEEDRPLTGPPLNDTSYYTGDCLKNKRELFLYWNDPPKSSLQGQLTMYTIIADNKTLVLRAGSNYYYSAGVDCSSTYEILIYSATRVGLSLTPSSIIIPKQSEELTVVEDDLMFRVQDTSDISTVRTTLNISATWVTGNLAGDTSLILYMCQETYPNTCLNDLTAIEVNLGQGTLVLIDIPPSTNLFGYSLKNKKGQKRGINWTNCVFRADLKPAQPTGLIVNPGSHANSFMISWISTQCSRSTKVLIIHYYIYICPHLVINVTCVNVTINNLSISSYLAQGLKANHPYYVYMQAESQAGIGALSNPVRGYLNSSAVSEVNVQLIIGATFGTVTSVFLVGLLIFVLARWCLKAKMYFENLTKSPFWNINENLKETYAHQNSFESGVFTGSTKNSTAESIIKPIDSTHLYKEESQQSSQPPTDKHYPHIFTEETGAQSQKFLQEQLEEEDKSSAEPPTGENSNPSSNLQSQSDYIRCGLFDTIDNPNIDSLEELDRSSQSMNTTDNSLSQIAHFSQICDVDFLCANNDITSSCVHHLKVESGDFISDASCLAHGSQPLAAIEDSDNQIETKYPVTTDNQIDLNLCDPVENKYDDRSAQSSCPGYVALNALQPDNNDSFQSVSFPTSDNTLDLSVDSFTHFLLED